MAWPVFWSGTAESLRREGLAVITGAPALSLGFEQPGEGNPIAKYFTLRDLGVGVEQVRIAVQNKKIPVLRWRSSGTKRK